MRIIQLMLVAATISVMGCGKEEPAQVSNATPEAATSQPAVIGTGPEFSCTAKVIGDAGSIPYDPLKGVERTMGGQLIVRSSNAETAAQALKEFFDRSGNRYEGGGASYMDAALHIAQGWEVEQCEPYANSVDGLGAKEVPLEQYHELKTQREGIALWMKLQGDSLDPERGGHIWSREAAHQPDGFARKDAALKAFEEGAKPAIAEANPNFIAITPFSLTPINMKTMTYDLVQKSPVGKNKTNAWPLESIGSKDNSAYAPSFIFDGGKEFLSYKPASEEEARRLESMRNRPMSAYVYAQAVKGDRRYSIVAIPVLVEVRDDQTGEVIFKMKKS